MIYKIRQTIIKTENWIKETNLKQNFFGFLFLISIFIGFSLAFNNFSSLGFSENLNLSLIDSEKSLNLLQKNIELYYIGLILIIISSFSFVFFLRKSYFQFIAIIQITIILLLNYIFPKNPDMFFLTQYNSLYFYSFLFFLIIITILTYNNKKITNILFTSFISILAISLGFLLNLGIIINKSNYLNHFRLDGYHTNITSASEVCVENGHSLWFKYYVIPVYETCYFDRYKLSDDDIISSQDERFLQMVYGGAFNYQNFILFVVKDIENYNENNAVYLYQIAYEALEKQVNKNEGIVFKNELNDNFHKISKNLIEIEKKNYLLSKQIPSDEFISIMKKELTSSYTKEKTKPILTEYLVKSLNIKNESNIVKFSRLKKLYENVISKK